jgi:hypothetical protein
LSNLENQPEVRRIVLQLDKPTRKGENPIRWLTNFPSSVASAIRLAMRFRERWGREKLFQRRTVVLNAEVRPLGYPQAALFGFAVALGVSNAFTVGMEALQASDPKQPIREELSYYQVGLELSQSKNLLERVAEEIEESLREMKLSSFADWLKELVAKVQWKEYRKTHRDQRNPARNVRSVPLPTCFHEKTPGSATPPVTLKGLARDTTEILMQKPRIPETTLNLRFHVEQERNHLISENRLITSKID